ncbi:MAG: hypothetical protein KJN76_02965 [Eudoraea sp.]|nr:hypothetical protein [Eudoraea sp.]
MKKNNRNIDELIKETLSEEEAKFYDELEEQNIFGKMGEVYKGKFGWLAVIMNIITFIAFVLFIYCIIQFLNTQETNELIKWASAAFLCAIIMGMLKLFVWLQMDKNDILRELKRLELQLATLMSKLEK